MRDAVRKAKVKTVVSFHLRWNPIFKTIKHITPEALGDIYYLEVDYNSHISDWWSGWGWGKKKDIGVSSFLVAGVHAVDALRWFAGKGEFKTANITEVMSYSGGYRNKLNSKDPEYVGYPGFEIMLLKLDTGAIGKVSCNYDCIQPYTFPWKIYGNKGTIRDNEVWSKMFPGQNDWVKVPSILPDTPDVAHHPFQGEMDHFVECILNDRESHCNLDDVVNTHEAALAAIQSSENDNIKIKLPLIK